MSAWTRKALPHRTSSRAIRIAVRSASSAGSASATCVPAPNRPAPQRREWLPTCQRACAMHRRRAGHRRSPDVRRSAPRFRRLIRSVGFDRGCRPSVQLGAIGLELRLAGHRADRRMPNAYIRTRSEPDLIDQFGLDQLVTRPGQSPALSAGRGQTATRTAAALDVRFLLVEADRCVLRWSCNVAGTLMSPPSGRDVCAALTAQHATLGQFPHDLLGEKRVTSGPLGDRLGPIRQPRSLAPSSYQPGLKLRIAQRRKRYRLCTVHPRPALPPSRGDR